MTMPHKAYLNPSSPSSSLGSSTEATESDGVAFSFMAILVLVLVLATATAAITSKLSLAPYAIGLADLSPTRNAYCLPGSSLERTGHAIIFMDHDKVLWAARKVAVRARDARVM